LLITLLCSLGVPVFDGLPRRFLSASPFVAASSFCLVGTATTTVATFLTSGAVSPVFAGRPRARFGASE
jgi:hypothetical protein